MELRVPGGSWFDWLVQSGQPGATGSSTSEPSTADVEQSIDAMRDGHLEFVILDAGDGTFVQAAGQGEHGYQLEAWAGGEPVSMIDTASLGEVRAAMASYLAGDRRGGLPPSAPSEGRTAGPVEQRAKRRWFGRG